MYSQIVASSNGQKNLRIQLQGELKDRWEDLLERKHISQQRAVEQLVRFILQQDDVTQSMVLGQLDPREDLVAHVLNTLARQKRPHRPGVFGTIAAKKGDPTKGAD